LRKLHLLQIYLSESSWVDTTIILWCTGRLHKEGENLAFTDVPFAGLATGNSSTEIKDITTEYNTDHPIHRKENFISIC